MRGVNESSADSAHLPQRVAGLGPLGLRLNETRAACAPCRPRAPRQRPAGCRPDAGPGTGPWSAGGARRRASAAPAERRPGDALALLQAARRRRCRRAGSAGGPAPGRGRSAAPSSSGVETDEPRRAERARARAAQRREVRAHAERAAEVERQRADVGPLRAAHAQHDRVGSVHDTSASSWITTVRGASSTSSPARA